MSAAGHGQQVVREWQDQMALDVDPAGQVARVTLLNEVPDAIAKPVSAVMQQWRFKRAKNGVTQKGVRWPGFFGRCRRRALMPCSALLERRGGGHKAKYAAAFFKMSRSSVTRASSRLSCTISESRSALRPEPWNAASPERASSVFHL